VSQSGGQPPLRANKTNNKKQNKLISARGPAVDEDPAATRLREQIRQRREHLIGPLPRALAIDASDSVVIDYNTYNTVQYNTSPSLYNKYNTIQ